MLNGYNDVGVKSHKVFHALWLLHKDPWGQARLSIRIFVQSAHEILSHGTFDPQHRTIILYFINKL